MNGRRGTIFGQRGTDVRPFRTNGRCAGSGGPPAGIPSAVGFEGWVVLEEEWRPVVGFEGLYEVSNQGRVRRVGRAARTGKGRGGGAVLGRVLKTHPIAEGYIAAQLWRDGKPFNRLVHALVAAAFIGPAPDEHEVNHRDGVKAHNWVDNLEYLTHSENNRHAYRLGLRQPTRQIPSPRRKPRISIECACGCGTSIKTPDPKGRERSFVSGHNMRRSA